MRVLPEKIPRKLVVNGRPRYIQNAATVVSVHVSPVAYPGQWLFSLVKRIRVNGFLDDPDQRKGTTEHCF